MSEDSDRALATLLAILKASGYRFTTPTPLTHARVISRRVRAENLRDVFGWSLPFSGDVVGPDIADLLLMADAVEQEGELFRSRVRISTLGDDYFLHSAFPTTQHDSVFFGPDSYRFASFLKAELPTLGPRRHVVDIGAGAGAGAIAAARVLPDAYYTLTDINPRALRFSAINWVMAELGAVYFSMGDALSDVPDVNGAIDCIIANPPYIIDGAHRTYRDGGGMHGAEVALAWAQAAAARLERGGALLLYTGSAIVGGEDAFRSALLETLNGFDVSYRELDPDVFGEELERDEYADVERIAVVGVVAIKA
ncbi:methyltransferase [Terricaulis sp.]|uniref:methyltransferase n=1 Tax=Terricaulis sp. TaxID=2768686 RepID=UPI0037844A76